MKNEPNFNYQVNNYVPKTFSVLAVTHCDTTGAKCFLFLLNLVYKFTNYYIVYNKVHDGKRCFTADLFQFQ